MFRAKLRFISKNSTILRAVIGEILKLNFWYIYLRYASYNDDVGRST